MRYFGFSKAIAKRFSCNAAILIGWILNETPEDGGEIETTLDKIKAGTCLTDREVQSARATLGRVLRHRHIRLEHRSFWEVDQLLLLESIGLQSILVSRPDETSSPEPTKRQPGNPQNVSPSIDLDSEEKTKNRIPRGARVVVASGEAKAMIQRFAEIFRLRFQTGYVPHPRDDVCAAQALLAAGITLDVMASVFERATRATGFWASKIASLPTLAKRWNEVQAELGAGIKNVTGTDSRQSGDDWVRELNGHTTISAATT